MNFSIHRFDSLASTNDTASKLASEGAPEGTVVIAREQTSGRGRHGRFWLSPEGGLYLSIVFRPDIGIESVWQTGFAASLAAAEAIEEASGVAGLIKWPNDVLLNGRKVCGILVEHPSSNPMAVVIGIGINVEPVVFPSELVESATSMSVEAGRSIPMSDVEAKLLRSIDRWYDVYRTEGFEPIFSAWIARDCISGRAVEIRAPDGVIRGIARSISPDGSLLVETEDGSTVGISAGDVILGC